MKNQKFALIGVLALVVIIGAVWLLKGGSDRQEVSTLDPIDTALSLYNPWQEAVKSTETDPYREGLHKTAILSPEVREKLKQAEDRPEGDLDPVLCQTTADYEIKTRIVSETENKVEILVGARNEDLTNQSLFTMNRLNDGWYISDISCYLGEFAPEKEFSFEKEGFLLKDNIPSPYDSQYWHLVFKENGVDGHVVPLFFNDQSMCTNLAGNEAVCNPNEDFMETDRVSVQGQLTERGADVSKVRLLEQ